LRVSYQQIRVAALFVGVMGLLAFGALGALGRPTIERVAERSLTGREAQAVALERAQADPGRWADHQSRLDALVREVRVFSGCNLGLFAVVTFLAAWRWHDTPQLVAPAAALAGTTCAGVAIYLLAQNWSEAFLRADYLGFWYLPWVAAGLLLLADMGYNDSEISSVIARVLHYLQV
jgi:hypothetical protein